MNQPSVFDFFDYRAFMQAYYEFKKDQDSKYSFQTLADKAGFKSRSFLHLVMNGKKNLTPSALFQVCAALDLKQKESEYFEVLVHFNQAKKPEEKNFYYEKLRKITVPKKQKMLKQDEFDFFSFWYIPPLRELLTSPVYKGSYEDLAARLIPPISPKEAQKGAAILERLGLIKKVGKKFVLQEADLHSGDSLHSLAVHNFQLKTMELAMKSLKNHPPEIREISTITMGLDQQSLKLLKKRLVEFRQEIADTMNVDASKVNQVYQLNLQLFPLSTGD
jgi:uncharacterized protein (TIGR02147 family)